MMYTENSYLLAHHLAEPQLRIYPDSGRGFLDQYPTLFADHVTTFSTADEAAIRGPVAPH